MGTISIPQPVKTTLAGQSNGWLFWARVILAPLRVNFKTDLTTVYLFPRLHRALVLLNILVRAVPLLVVLAVLLWVFLTIGLILFLVALFLFTEGTGRTYEVVRKPKPTSNRGVKSLMVQAEVVKVGPGERMPKFRAVGPLVKDEFGQSRKFRVPNSTTEAVQKKEAVMAGILGRPASLFSITQDLEDPPNVFTMWIGANKGRKTATAQVPNCCNFHEPFRIGRTLAGKPVLVNTFEFNTLIGGIPGMGKTATVRVFILRALLDPDGEVYLVDGKGSKKDYRAAAHAYSGYIDGNEDDAIEQVLALLENLHERINRANSNEETLKILLVLDEWQDVRAGADKDMLKIIDTLLTRITKKGRATGFHIVLATQRASAISIRTEDRSLFRQALAFRQKNGTDYGMVLGHSPDVAEPTNPGEAILMGDAGQTFVLVDELSQTQWLTAAQRLTPRDSLSLVVAHEPDALAQAIGESAHRLTQQEVRCVQPSELWAMLTEDVRPSTAAVLGRWLAAKGIEKTGRDYLVADLREIR